jgi:hypothetical protein
MSKNPFSFSIHIYFTELAKSVVGSSDLQLRCFIMKAGLHRAISERWIFPINRFRGFNKIWYGKLTSTFLRNSDFQYHCDIINSNWRKSISNYGSVCVLYKNFHTIMWISIWRNSLLYIVFFHSQISLIFGTNLVDGFVYQIMKCLFSTTFLFRMSDTVMCKTFVLPLCCLSWKGVLYFNYPAQNSQQNSFKYFKHSEQFHIYVI